MTALDLAVLDGLRARLADTEARLAATEQALAEARALLVRRDAGGVAVSTADGGGARTGEPAPSAPGAFCEALGVAAEGTPYACDLQHGHEGSHRAPTGHAWQTTEPDEHGIHGAVVEEA